MNEKKETIRLQSAEDLKKPVKQRDPKKGRMLLYALAGIILLTALVIGVTYAATLFDRIPSEKTDIPAACLVTEDGIIRTHE